MRKLLLAILTLCIAAPAAANWGSTHWGMTPEEVVAAVPGTRVTEHKPGEDVMDRQMLVFGPSSDGDVRLLALFYFDAETRQLAFVKTQVVDKAQCQAWEAMLVARYGEGRRDSRNIGRIAMMAIRWTDPATGEKLLYSSISGTGQDSLDTCHFITNWVN